MKQDGVKYDKCCFITQHQWSCFTIAYQIVKPIRVNLLGAFRDRGALRAFGLTLLFFMVLFQHFV